LGGETCPITLGDRMGFTPREKRILEMLFQGKTHEQIRKHINAEKLHLSGCPIDKAGFRYLVSKIRRKVYFYEKNLFEIREDRVKLKAE